MSIVSSVGEWVGNHLTWMWLWIIFGAVFAELFWHFVVVLRAWDIRWDVEKAKKARPKAINLKKAVARRSSVPLFGLPLFGLWVAAVVYQFQHWDWQVYLTIATIWLLSAPLREIWLVHVARRVKVKQGQTLDNSLFEAVSRWYSSGLSLPGNEHQEPWFEDRLKILNVFQKYRYVIHVFRFWGVLVEMLAALVWPIIMVWSIFHYVDEVDNYDQEPPWWRLDRHRRSV